MATYEPVGQLSYHRISHNMGVWKRHVDVDIQTGASSASQIDANDVLTAIPVRTGDIVLQAWINVLTSCTGAASADVGVGENVDCFVDGVAVDGQVVETAVAAGSNGPHRFHTADTIDCKILEAAVTAGKFEVCALIIRI